MRKPSSKWVMLAASAGLLVCTASKYISFAEEKIYVDSDVSISAAIERYIASNGDATDITTTAVSTADTTADTTASSTDAAPSVNMQSAEANKIKYPEFQGKAVVSISDNVNIRKEPSVDSERVGIIGAGGIMNVMTRGDEWSYVASGNVMGYICNDYIVFDDEAGELANTKLGKAVQIDAASLRVRKSASVDSEIVTMVPYGERYAIIEEGPEWTLIEIDETFSGYVSNEYISFVPNVTYACPIVTTVATTNNSNNNSNNNNNNSNNNNNNSNSNNNTQTQTTQATTEQVVVAESPTSSALGAEIANFALQFVGNPYVYGGSSLTNGADCSGFTMSVYANFGISLPHGATSQSRYGTEVSLSALQPGDLVFYDHGTGSIEHVALYIGNGQVVHASSSRTGIIVSNVNYNTPFKAVRLVQ